MESSSFNPALEGIGRIEDYLKKFMTELIFKRQSCDSGNSPKYFKTFPECVEMFRNIWANKGMFRNEHFEEINKPREREREC